MPRCTLRKLVKSATLQQSFTPGQLNDGSRLQYGFGWEIHSSTNMTALLHVGGWRGFTSFIVRVPGERFTIIALANHDWFDIRGLSRYITQLYWGSRSRFPRDTDEDRAEQGAAANPAIALRLLSNALGGRVTELGSFGASRFTNEL